MFKDVSCVWGGRQLPAQEKRRNSSSCMFGRFVPLYSFLCFIGILFIFCLKLRFLKVILTGTYSVIICIIFVLIVFTLLNVSA